MTAFSSFLFVLDDTAFVLAVRPNVAEFNTGLTPLLEDEGTVVDLAFVFAVLPLWLLDVFAWLDADDDGVEVFPATDVRVALLELFDTAVLALGVLRVAEDLVLAVFTLLAEG